MLEKDVAALLTNFLEALGSKGGKNRAVGKWAELGQLWTSIF
jgi:hypothetical protein